MRTKTNIQLPDYSKLFRIAEIRPLRFRVRDGANFDHDVQFLSSYLHDARLVPRKVKLNRRKLVIPLNRDCWELGYKEHARSVELYTANTELRITPVSSIQWELTSGDLIADEIWIESIYLGSAHWEKPGSTEFVVAAPHRGCRLRISIGDDYGDIRLTDLETPHLHSNKQ